MERARWQQIEQILDKALTFDTLREQEHYIKKACRKDLQLSEETIQLLLAIHEANRSGFLDD